MNNSVYCAKYNYTTEGCKIFTQVCLGDAYLYYSQDSDFFAEIATYIETLVDSVDIILSTIIILISIFGKIDGTFRWCIMNIAILHLFFPIFTRFITLQTLVNLDWRHSGWDSIWINFFLNSVFALGTQGVSTSIAGSLPLALNRFLLTHQSNAYDFFFNTKKRTAFWLIFYDLVVFGSFYSLYQISSLADYGFLFFPYQATYIVTIAVVVITNTASLMLMTFVLYQIYLSLAIVKQLDQKRLLMERKRIAWLIVTQSGINFVLGAFRVIAFMNVANTFGDGKTMGCYGPFLNFYDQNSYFFQELFVCLDGLMYIFFLPTYREELFRFFKKILRRDTVHVITVSSQSNVIRAANIAR